jgi:hypothetical protein
MALEPRQGQYLRKDVNTSITKWRANHNNMALADYIANDITHSQKVTDPMIHTNGDGMDFWPANATAISAMIASDLPSYGVTPAEIAWAP